ncbi:MAG TPA: DegT/DnrJ/EryC1/StrS family aminotransferase [Acidimicrobiales bacterium]|nr:DegT/DnrJ/EryC1/StrS family aminotransferase [Acidimicrobiales bacterium]
MIPVNEPLLDDVARDNVLSCLEGGWISSEGRFVSEFEQKWAEYCGRAFGVAVCNGTAALELAFACLGIEAGDEVILPAFTIISCVLAVLEAGAIPVLVDCDADTWCMDVDQVAAKITPRTRVIQAVHIYGHPVDMAPLRALAETHGILIVEDAAEAHGAHYDGQPIGSFGIASCFSFYANKIITTGEGGMVLSDDADLAERLRAGRNLGFRSDRRFRHTELSHNYRMTNLQAAVGVAQVHRIEHHVALKRAMADRYRAGLASCDQIRLPVERGNVRNVYWMYGVVLDEDCPFDAVGFADALRERQIDTRPFFLGMHEQPVLKELGLFEGECYPNCEQISRRGLYLPSGLTVTAAQQQAVVEAVLEVLES